MTEDATVEEPEKAPEPPQQPGGQPAATRRKFASGFATLRDGITFAAGLAFVGNEVFISASAEPAIIAVGVTMMGLPLVFGADERKRGGGPNDEGGSS